MPQIINVQAIEGLRNLGDNDNNAFLSEIIGIYLQDTPERIADLKTLLSGDDQQAFIRAAHTIKGSSANLGAEEVRAAAEVIEQQACTVPAAELSPQVLALTAAFDRARVELEKLIQSH